MDVIFSVPFYLKFRRLFCCVIFRFIVIFNGITTESRIILRIKYQITFVLLIFLLILSSGYGSSHQSETLHVQNELYFPLIYHSLVNQLPPTKIPKPTITSTPTRTLVPFSSSTPIPTATQTLTATLTPTLTLTPTYTATTTLIPLASITIQFPSLTPSVTPSFTPSQTLLPSSTPPSGLFPGLPPSGWLIIILLGILWIILAIWLYVFLRQRN